MTDQTTTPEPRRQTRPDPEFPLWSEMPEPPLYSIVENQAGHQYQSGVFGWSNKAGANLTWRDFCLAHGPFKLRGEPDAGGSTTTPACLCDTDGCPVHDDTAVTCDTCRPGVTIPGYDAKAHEVRNPGHRVATVGARFELEADVRALGGDPDRMVDPRDHQAAIEAMRAEMQPDQSGPHIIGGIGVARARDIAERHMLRMAQGAMSGESAHSCENCSGIDPATCFNNQSAPVVREVPAGEAREGDTVTIVGEIRNLRLPGRMIVAYGSGRAIDLPIDGDGWTITRPVSPLPDQPGAVIRCRVEGMLAGKTVVAELQPNAWQWAVMGMEGRFHSDSVTLVDVLHLPAGAGVDEGGNR